MKLTKCRMYSRKLLIHPDSAWKRSSELHETYQCRIYSRELLMMGKEDARNV